MCGFAWVNISPARGKFVNYLKKLNKGHKSYYGGWDYWVSSQELGQSMKEKKPMQLRLQMFLKSGE